MDDWRHHVEQLRESVATMPSTSAAHLIGDLERVQTLAQMRIRAPEPEAPRPAPDDFLTASQAAAELGMGIQWVYDHARELGGERRGGAWRFPRRRIERYRKASREGANG
jgi:hypothetical protein